MTDHQQELKRAQTAARGVYDKMMETMLGFTPCERLTIGDAQFIARMAQTHAFDAIRDCLPAA